MALLDRPPSVQERLGKDEVALMDPALLLSWVHWI